MSHPSPIGTNVHGKISRPIASTSNTTTSNSNAGVGGGGLLSKLRKQFHSGHLR